MLRGKRDPLLGPVASGSKPAGDRPHTLKRGSIAVVVIAALAFAGGYLWLGDDAPHTVEGVSPPAASPQPTHPTPRSAMTPEVVPAPEPPFRLKPITEADWHRLGSGCVCAFSLSRRGSELLIAGGDDLAIVRPDGAQKVCLLGEDDMQAMFDGDARIDCGAARLLIKSYGEPTPGFDGHSTAAKLTVIYRGAERSFDGNLACGC